MFAATGPQARCAHIAFSPFSPSNQQGLKLFQRFETNEISVVQGSRNIHCDFIELRLVITLCSVARVKEHSVRWKANAFSAQLRTLLQ
jgi:hypothetical protein